MIIPIWSFSQTVVKDNFYEVAFKTQQTMTYLAESIYKTNSVELRNSFVELEETHNRLFKILVDYSESDNVISEDYLLSLENSQKVLEELSNPFEDIKASLRLFEAIKYDYKAKLQSIDYGISISINEKVKVTVKTTKSSGYFAYIKYSSDENINIKRLRFNNPTNNAERYLSPGYYIIWVEKDNNKSKERFIEITSTNEDQNTIYFEL
ncbi:hypothetical protein GCM10011444_28020 [Winogradskyella haliclonae]|uniref:Uncharacterized protein n=2 Tax=Winogradskyella haliclonae TaxID=2048558 RepID=A0ABQ2C5X2_9FLAO|nr:hypothetical protein GCM10011444_28020 [Winogradskyella haliclonae]